MPSSLPNIVDAIVSGSEQQLRDLLAKGFKWPADPVQNPVLDLLAMAQHRPDVIDLPGKLEALLDHGLDREFTLPWGTKVPERRARAAMAGLPGSHTYRNDNVFLSQANLLARAAGCGRTDLVEVLRARGAQMDTLDDEGKVRTLPLRLAAENRHYDMLLHLVPRQGAATPSRWKSWAKTALKQLPDKRDDLLTLIMETCPDLDTEAGRRAVLEAASDNKTHQAMLRWLERDLSLWDKLHDEPIASDNRHDKHFLSLWPALLEHAKQHGCKTALFQHAMAHAKRTGWLGRPVATHQVNRWDWLPAEDRPGKADRVMGWTNHAVGLPPLQALLHHSSPPRYKRDYRRVRRVAGALRKAGAPLWAGKGAKDAQATEAMLWEQARQRPPVRWLLKHPVLLLAHPTTGETPLHVAHSVEGAKHWLACGVSPGAVDAHGNQAFTSIVSRTAKAWAEPSAHYMAKSQDWANWVEECLHSDAFPLQGHAHGKALSEWVCTRHALYQAWCSRTRQQPSTEGTALHVAAQNLNATTMEALLTRGHEGGKLDQHGWSPLSYLVNNLHCLSDGHDENALKRCVAVVQKHQMPSNVPGQEVDPWQLALSGKGAHNFLYHSSAAALDALFWDVLHAPRMTDPARWTPQDAPLLVGHFLDIEAQRFFSRRLLPSLPQSMLDDMALSLFNPCRWPHGAEQEMALAPGLLRLLLAAGADLNATGVDGLRLIDCWPTLVQHEKQLRQDGNDTWRVAHALLDMPESKRALAAVEGQTLEGSTVDTKPLANHRRRL